MCCCRFIPCASPHLWLLEPPAPWAQNAGLSTLEIEVGENVGEDWEEVLDQRQREIESCLKRGLPLPSWAQADQFASQTITDPEEK